MSATLAPTPWSASATTAGPAWGMVSLTDDGQAAVRWDLRRNCSLTPAQLGSAYAAVCGLSLLIALGFALNGAPVVLLFSGLELLLLGVAFLVFARHVRDGDALLLKGPLLRVEQSTGPRTVCTEFRAEWVSVEPRDGEGSLVEISGQGQRVLVGRFIRPELRARLARDLRLALRTARSVPHAVPAA